ncbi:hypothetical protein ACLOJK_008629 [Asimina triloba]
MQKTEAVSLLQLQEEDGGERDKALAVEERGERCIYIKGDEDVSDVQMKHQVDESNEEEEDG